MNSFAIAQPGTFAEAAALLRDRRFKLPVLKAGGMDVVDHLKEGLIAPDALINIKRVRRNANAGPISMLDGAGREPLIEVDATATMAEIAGSNLLRKHAPVVAQALESAASPQVRNVGTAAGNLLQRPRCWYYRNAQFDCLKKGGHTCYAVNGENRYHAIFGDGTCHIVHPSNLAPALFICSGEVHIIGEAGGAGGGGAGGRGAINISDLFHMPDKGIASEHNLQPGEVVTHITLQPRPHSGFYAIKEKQSFDWPLVMCAAALELDGSIIRKAEVCAGAVAPTPWPLPKVAEALAGVNVDDDAALRKACEGAATGAKPMTDNAYKVRLLPVAVRRAVLRAAGRFDGDEWKERA